MNHHVVGVVSKYRAAGVRFPLSRTLIVTGLFSFGVLGGCASQSVRDSAQPSVTCVILPYHAPSVFYLPTVVPSGQTVWIAPDRPGSFLVLDSVLNDLGSSINFAYQVDRIVIGGQNLGSERVPDALVHQFDTGASYVWWHSESTHVVATFSKDFTLADIKQFVDGLQTADRAAWDEFAKSQKKLDIRHC